MSKANTIGAKYHRIRLHKNYLVAIHKSNNYKQRCFDLPVCIQYIATRPYYKPMICTHISHEAIQYSGVVQGLNITPLYTFNLNGNLITDITPVDL